jgi:hypothetical protein
MVMGNYVAIVQGALQVVHCTLDFGLQWGRRENLTRNMMHDHQQKIDLDNTRGVRKRHRGKCHPRTRESMIDTT